MRQPLPLLIRVFFAFVLNAASASAQFFDYGQVQEAGERAAAAERRFIIALAGCAVVAATLALRAIVHYRRRIRPGQVADITTAPPAAVLAGAFTALAIAFRIFGVLIILAWLASCASLIPEPDSIPTATAYFASAALLWLGGMCASQSARLRTPLAEDVLSHDPRPPVLFLRCFAHEEIALPNQTQWWMSSEIPAILEDSVLAEFRAIGPVIGLSNPRLAVRPGSYSPYDTRSETWRERVSTLIEKAAAVVVIVAQSESLAWEIRYLRDKGRLSQTLFILPALDAAAVQTRLRWLISELGLPQDLTARRIAVSASHPGQELAILFSPGVARVYLETPNRYGYALAVKRALEDLRRPAAGAAAR